VNLLAGEAKDALVPAAAIRRLIVKFREGLNVLACCRAAKEKWLCHRLIRRPRLQIGFVLSQMAFEFSAVIPANP